MAKKKLPRIGSKFATARQLQRTAAIMLPVYRAIALNKGYAGKWGKAVVAADLDQMTRLLAIYSPHTKGLPLGSNGIGYFVSFPLFDTDSQLTNGTTIIPGSTQFVFDVRTHRAIARAVYPLYRELARNLSFAAAFTKAVKQKDREVLRRMVHSLVRTPALTAIETGIEAGGIALTFKYAFSKYKYRNLLYYEMM